MSGARTLAGSRGLRVTARGLVLAAAVLLLPLATRAAATGPPQVSISSVRGAFYLNPNNSGALDPSYLTSPAFTQDFPVIDFNPPAAAQVGCSNVTGVDETTRPFTDVVPEPDGTCSTVVAQGGGAQAGTGDLPAGLFAFQAVFTANLQVAQPGQVTFNLFSDDGWMLGAGPRQGGTEQPAYIAGSDLNPLGSTPSQHYQVVGSYNTNSSPAQNQVTVSFPAAGTYPIELDYTECCGGQLSLVLGTTFGNPIPPGASRMVALGDSYISGEGTYSHDAFAFPIDYYGGEEGGSAYPQSTIGGFNSDSASASDRCHRSPASYAPLVGVQELDFVACSGATIGDVEAGSSSNGEVSQLNVLTPQDGVVLVSAGGDDLGFATVLSSCVDGPFFQHQSENGGCKKAIDQASASIGTVQDHLSALFSEIRDQQHAPNARIVQIGYPRLFPVGGTGSTCSGINSTRQGWLNAAGDTLDAAIAATDAANGVTFVDTRSVFAQHELCSGSPYLNDLQLDAHFGPFGPNNCPDDYTVVGDEQVCSQSFHPNTLGYRAEAAVISSALASSP